MGCKPDRFGTNHRSPNLQSDTFTFRVSREKKPFTRRGILSTVNGLCDPLGFVACITIQGKALVRELSAEQCEWDAPLPARKGEQWRLWSESVSELEQLQIEQPYVPTSTTHKELCVSSDASTKHTNWFRGLTFLSRETC